MLMRITVLAVGSRGEVEPLVALAAGLARSGHDVCLATHAEFLPLAEGRGLRAHVLWGSLDEALATDAGQRLVHSGYHVIRAGRALVELLRLAGRLYDDCWDACRGAEAIVYGQIAVAGPHIAAVLRVPAIGAFVNPLYPGRPTAEFSAPGAPPWPLGRAYNRLTHVGVAAGFAAVWRSTLNAWCRSRLGLRPLSLAGVLPGRDPIVFGFSPTLVPRPREWRGAAVTGYWFLEPLLDWQPPAEVVEFLAAGPPPVYVGFGTMKLADRSVTATVVEALKRSGHRGILLRGSDEEEGADLPVGFFGIRSVPFRWLFPRVAAAIHHGGLGTSHAALHAGIPQVVVPFMGDQPFWASRLARVGVAAPMLPRRRLTAERLAQAMRTATTEATFRERAVEVALSAQRDPGVAAAAEFVNRRLLESRGRHSAW